MDAALSTTVDGLRSTGKRIKKGNAALSDAMSDAYDEVNLLDPARQIGLTSQGRGDPSIMRSINTPLVAGAQMGLGAANAAYRGTANLLGQGVEGVRSALPKSLSDYVGTGAQFERDFNAMPEFLAGTGFGLIPASVPPIAKGFAEGTSVRNAERGMFAGVGAKTADLEALKVAKKLETDGIDRDAIWSQTGWGRGADNKWRFEIDDSGARLMRGVKTKIKNNGIATGSAKEILDHPELYAAEPKNRGLYHRATTMFGNEGSWDANKKSILASGRTNDEILSTSLHEHQHAIQDRAGFAQGSSPDNFDYGPMFDKRARDLIGDLSKSLTGDYSHNYYSTLSKDLHLGDKSELNRIVKKYGFDNIEDGMKFLKIEDAKRSPYEQYRRVAGEVEARNVETRMNMTPAERLLTPPWKTEDVARDKQIVRFGGGKSMSLPTDDLPMDEALRIKLSAAKEYNTASYLDGTGPDYKINDLLEADNNFVPGKSRALYKSLEEMGVRVDGYPSGGTSDYFTIKVLDKNNPLDEFGDQNFNEFKIRVADHGNTTNKYNQPDLNVSPENYTLNEAIDKLYNLVKSNQVEMDEASRMARATSKYKPKIVDGSTFPDPDTQKGRMAIQGGPLAAKPGIDRLIKTLDSHGMDWKYSENGGITAYAEVRGPDGKWFKEGKHFDEKSSLKTLRDWLGY
jgi:hypothetical protein